MGIIMKRITLLAGIVLTISGLFASQTFAASGCVTAACDPVAAAVTACDPVAASPASAPAADENSNPSADGAVPAPTDAAPAAPASADPASCSPAAANNSGCLSAAPGCGSGAPRGCCDLFFGKLTKSLCDGVCWSGYMNGGYDTNFAGDRSNGLVDAWNNTTPAFNAVYIAAQKKAFTGGCGYDFGWGVDFMFGEDSRIFRSARGLDENWYTGHMYNPLTEAYDRPSYGFAMPQLYMEMAINNWSVKLGHFYGLLGYEGATAPSRFFYTKGLTCAATPVSQTGVLATFNGFENLDVTLGWVNGWGNGFDNSEFGEGMVTGAFTYHMNKYASIKYAFLAGTADMAGVFGYWGPYDWAPIKGVGGAHSVVLDLHLTSALESVTTLHYVDFGLASDPGQGSRALILGEHLYYTINCCWKAGFRVEWMKDTVYSGGDSNTEVTSYAIGLNWHPAGNQNLYVRPELRYDRAIGDLSDQALNGRVDQFTIGFDVMLTF